MTEYLPLQRYHEEGLVKLRILQGINDGKIDHYRDEKTFNVMVNISDIKKYLKDTRKDIKITHAKTKKRIQFKEYRHELVNPSLKEKKFMRGSDKGELNLLVTTQGYVMCSVSELLSFAQENKLQQLVVENGYIKLKKEGGIHVRQNQNQPGFNI